MVTAYLYRLQTFTPTNCSTIAAEEEGGDKGARRTSLASPATEKGQVGQKKF